MSSNPTRPTSLPLNNLNKCSGEIRTHQQHQLNISSNYNLLPATSNENTYESIHSFIMDDPPRNGTTTDEIDASNVITLQDIIFDESNVERPSWNIFGKPLSRSFVIASSQILVVMFLIIASVVNLTLSDTCEKASIWGIILSGAIAFLIPSPPYSSNNNNNNRS